jgi:hypothetical protein
MGLVSSNSSHMHNCYRSVVIPGFWGAHKGQVRSRRSSGTVVSTEFLEEGRSIIFCFNNSCAPTKLILVEPYPLRIMLPTARSMKPRCTLQKANSHSNRHKEVKLAEAAILLTCIQEATGSNLGRNTNCSD